MSRRTAAALLITRGQGHDLEILLCERSPELRFFGGYFALPGGTLADDDKAYASTAPDDDDSAALQACALRELFEETGLLRHRLRTKHSSQAALRASRTALLASELHGEAKKAAAQAPTKPPRSPFYNLVDDAERPAPMRILCRIETPPFAPVRYDTVFLHAPLAECTAGTNDGAPAPDIWPGELVAGRFMKPAAALAAWRGGELLLVPPVVILCEHLAAHTDFEAFAHAINATAESYYQGRLHQVRFSPGIVLAPLKTPTLPPATTTNCLIVGTDELWVIDPGSPDEHEQQRLLALLTELERGGARTVGILSTHHHRDHTGGIAALCEAKQLRVRGHPLTLDRLPQGAVLGEPIHDGESLALGKAPDGTSGWELRAVHTPGHDRGHLCFVENRYGAAMVGDMLSTVSTIIVDPPEGHLATYLRSLERLLQEPLNMLYPAHGPALRDGGKLVKQYLRHRRQRETALQNALNESPGTVEQLLPKVYWDADPRLYRFAARSLLAGLQKLQEEGRAESDGEVWRARV
jgi:glyoxylase-like metal-dependent hydrolase (beta-lactamase superfamily II)/8-oxo-dGTP pyrophosphatase MutT (NUDIX family)